jgi:hypothetical protein
MKPFVCLIFMLRVRVPAQGIEVIRMAQAITTMATKKSTVVSGIVMLPT